jgi:hypothetical protein
MAIMGVPQFERFFREAASLDVDKMDIDRFDDFVNDKIAHLVIRGEAVAKANSRDVIEPWDLPITKGLQENVHRFREMDAAIDLEPILERLTGWPQLQTELSEETRAELPSLAGGVAVALARSFKLVDPAVKNPAPEHWQRSFELFDLLL